MIISISVLFLVIGFVLGAYWVMQLHERHYKSDLAGRELKNFRLKEWGK